MRTSIKVPFPGLYHTWLSQALDYEEESEVEYRAGEWQEYEEKIPEELRLSAETYAELYFKHTNYAVAHDKLARGYLEHFNEWAKDLLGFDLELEFEEMTSPRFYNFETDRLFARVSQHRLLRLLAINRRDGFKKLGELLGERHTSRDGFISGYTNRLSEWLLKPVEEWDHNELETLLLAAIRCKGDDENSDDLMMAVLHDSELLSTSFMEAVDWDALDAEADELRSEIEEELLLDDPEYERPYRCDETPDLFHGG